METAIGIGKLKGRDACFSAPVFRGTARRSRGIGLIVVCRVPLKEVSPPTSGRAPIKAVTPLGGRPAIFSEALCFPAEARPLFCRAARARVRGRKGRAFRAFRLGRRLAHYRRIPTMLKLGRRVGLTAKTIMAVNAPRQIESHYASIVQEEGACPRGVAILCCGGVEERLPKGVTRRMPPNKKKVTILSARIVISTKRGRGGTPTAPASTRTRRRHGFVSCDKAASATNLYN